MRRRNTSLMGVFSFLVFLAVFCFSSVSLLPSNIDIPETNLIYVLSGEMKTIQLESTSERIDVGSSGIISLFMQDKKALTIKGLAPGFTTVFIRYSDGTLDQYGVTVTEKTPEYIKTLAEQVKKSLEPVTGISIKVEGSKIVITGSIENETEKDYFKQIVSMYSDFVLDLTGTYVDKSKEAETEPAERTDIVQIDVRIVQIRDTDSTKLGIKWFSKGPWTVSGNYGVNYDYEKERGKTTTKTSSDTYTDTKTRTKTKSYTGDNEGTTNWTHTDTDTTTDTDSTGTNVNIPRSWTKTIKYSSGISLDNIAFELIALAEEGKIKFLATPKLVVQSGKTASFLVGGEIPIAQSTGLVSTVDWKKYGTTLKINPTVISDDKVFINLKANMSELDWTNHVGNYPALLTKNAETNLTARDGETFAIAGLISQESNDKLTKVPLLGDIPLLGLLFRYKDKELIDTETIVFFTPHILKKTELDSIIPSPGMNEVLMGMDKEETEDKAAVPVKKAEEVKIDTGTRTTRNYIERK